MKGKNNPHFQICSPFCYPNREDWKTLMKQILSVCNVTLSVCKLVQCWGILSEYPKIRGYILTGKRRKKKRRKSGQKWVRMGLVRVTLVSPLDDGATGLFCGCPGAAAVTSGTAMRRHLQNTQGICKMV